MLVRGKGDKSGIILYTWHDGHTQEAVNDLLALPFTLFEISRESCKQWRLNKNHVEGPWFYDHYLGFALDPDRIIKGDCDGMVRWPRWTRKTVGDMWRCTVPLEVHTAGVANWMTFVRFNRWTAVPRLSWCSYPGDHPDITVDVDGGCCGSYLVTVDADMLSVDDECDELAKLNGRLNDPDVRIQRRSKHGSKLIKFYVPFTEIILQLIWQEIQTAYDVCDGTSASPESAWLKTIADQQREQREEFDRERAKEKVKS